MTTYSHPYVERAYPGRWLISCRVEHVVLGQVYRAIETLARYQTEHEARLGLREMLQKGQRP